MWKLQAEVANVFIPTMVLAIKHFIRDNHLLKKIPKSSICRMLDNSYFKNALPLKYDVWKLAIAHKTRSAKY